VKALVALVGGLVTVLGLWAFAAPQSFYDHVAIYPPYSAHLIHDLGAFQAGLGIALLAGLRWPALLPGALLANLLAAVLHTASHVEDLGRGGHFYDLPVVAAVAVILALAGALRWQRRSA
jgi:hypothetical protein